jgi:hypothetical protein
MSRETRSCKTHALTLSQIELHPDVDAPLGKNIKFSLCICKVTVLPATRKSILRSSAYKRMRSDLKHDKTYIMNKIKSKGFKMTTLGEAGSHRKSSRLRATTSHKLLAAGHIIPYPSKKAAAESQLSQLSQQQPMADLVLI